MESMVVTVQDMADVEETERLRAEFLSMVSHELREPLTSIKGSAVNLRESLDSLDRAEVLQFVRIIESQSDRMRDLIGELLDMARIKTGTLSVAPEPAEVSALVDEARNTFLTGGRGRDIVLDLEPDLPWVMADKRRIVQVLGNLLSNAVRLLAGDFRHPVERSADGRRRGAVRGGPGTGRGAGTAAPAVPQVLPRRRRRPGPRTSWGRVSAWPSAGESWKPTAGASGRRARAWAWAAGSPSPCPWPKGWRPGQSCVPAARGRRPRQQACILVVDDDPMTLRNVRDTLVRGGLHAPGHRGSLRKPSNYTNPNGQGWCCWICCSRAATA